MKIPQLKECLFGIRLKSASLLLAWILLVGSIILSLFALADIVDTINNFENNFKINNSFRELNKYDFISMAQQKHDRLVCAFAILIGMKLYFFMSFQALVGIYKEKPAKMRPLLIVSGFGVMFLALIAFNTAFSYHGIDRDVFQFLVLIGILYYCFLILYSHYMELKDQSGMNANLFAHQILTNEAILTNEPVKTSVYNIA